MTNSNDTGTKLYGRSLAADEQRDTFRNADVTVAVYGLGPAGLSLATVFACVSDRVVGVSVDEAVVDALEGGECPVDGDRGLERGVSKVLEHGSLTPTTETETAAELADVHVLAEPVVLGADRTPDLTALVETVESIGTGLDQGDLLVLEPLVQPGTTADMASLLATFSDLDRSTFGVAYSPHPATNGSPLHAVLHGPPRVVGGVDRDSTRAAAALFDEVSRNGVVTVADARAAECVPLFEAVYQDVTVALANQLAMLVEELDVDVASVIDHANRQPYCDIPDPSPGIDSPAVPAASQFLMHAVDAMTPLLATARRVNDSMPDFVVGQLLREFGGRETSVADAAVAVLGVGGRTRDEGSSRATPAANVVDRLNGLGATVYVVDPKRNDLSGFDAIPASLTDVAWLDVDAVIQLRARVEFEEMDWSTLEEVFVVDCSRTHAAAERSHRVYTIGSGTAETAETERRNPSD